MRRSCHMVVTCAAHGDGDQRDAMADAEARHEPSGRLHRIYRCFYLSFTDPIVHTIHALLPLPRVLAHRGAARLSIYGYVRLCGVIVRKYSKLYDVASIPSAQTRPGVSQIPVSHMRTMRRDTASCGLHAMPGSACGQSQPAMLEPTDDSEGGTAAAWHMSVA